MNEQRHQYVSLEEMRAAAMLRAGDPWACQAPVHLVYTRVENWCILRDSAGSFLGEFDSARAMLDYCHARGFTVRQRSAGGVVRFFRPEPLEAAAA